MKTSKSKSDRAKRWQAKQILAGNCECCGRPRKTYNRLCDYHHIKKNVSRRKSVEV